MDQFFRHAQEILPQLPTFLTLTAAAIFPIFAGAHASLSRPASAARPSKKSRSKKRHSKDQKRMEGLSPSDALLYPIMTGTVLTGLYYLIKYLQDPAILNKILNWYLSIFGAYSIWQLVNDALDVMVGIVFPSKYSHKGRTFKLDIGEKEFVFDQDEQTQESDRGSLASLMLLLSKSSPWMAERYWILREYLTTPFAVMEIYAKELIEGTEELSYTATLAALISIMAVCYYNLISTPWWLTNLFGFSFCYSAMQLMSPTTFWTGTMVLISLFFYDIYFVFYTPMMIEVATKLDIPAKLLIPRPGESDSAGKPAHTLLGLGDIVLPGIMLGLALRFDLHMFYLKKQQSLSVNAVSNGMPDVIKAEYVTATSGWGDRIWLDSKAVKQEGWFFPKPYFTAGMTGYVVSMLVTQSVMVIFKHGQPALLYLVPGVLSALWGTAVFRGEIKQMWEYTEDEDPMKKNSKNGKASVKNESQIGQKQEDSVSKQIAEAKAGSIESNEETEAQTEKEASVPSDGNDVKKANEKHDEQRLFYLSISWRKKPSSSTTKSEMEADHMTGSEGKNTSKQAEKPDGTDSLTPTSASFEIVGDENDDSHR